MRSLIEAPALIVSMARLTALCTREGVSQPSHYAPRRTRKIKADLSVPVDSFCGWFLEQRSVAEGKTGHQMATDHSRREVARSAVKNPKVPEKDLLSPDGTP